MLSALLLTEGQEVSDLCVGLGFHECCLKGVSQNIIINVWVNGLSIGQRVVYLLRKIECQRMISDSKGKSFDFRINLQIT